MRLVTHWNCQLIHHVARGVLHQIYCLGCLITADLSPGSLSGWKQISFQVIRVCCNFLRILTGFLKGCLAEPQKKSLVLRGNVWENHRGEKFKIKCILKVSGKQVNNPKSWNSPFVTIVARTLRGESVYQHRLLRQVGEPLWFFQTLPPKVWSGLSGYYRWKDGHKDQLSLV